MASFFEALNNAARGAACSIIGGTAFVDGFMRDIGVPGTGAYQDRTRALRRQLCNNSEDTVPVPGIPFSGGQCPGVLYEISFFIQTENYQNSGCNSTSTPSAQVPYLGSVPGPIESVRLELDTPGACGDRRYLVIAKHAQGEVILQQATTPFGRKPSGTFINNVLIRRIDGMPDNCGDPPIGIPDYQPTPTTINIEYEDNSQTTINEDVDITIFAPQVNIGGAIFAPITIAGNTFNLVGTVELTPEFKLNVSPEINVNLGNGNTDETLPGPDGDFPEPTIDPNERRVIVGAIVTATDVSPRVDFLPQDGNPDVGIPNLGLVSFYVTTPEGTAWTADIPIKNVRTYIPCPVAGGATDVAGTPRAGILLDVQPIWGYPGQNLPT
jgi:hypothetical protein